MYRWENGYDGTEWYDEEHNKVILPERFFATLVHNNEDVFVVSCKTIHKDMMASWDVIKCKIYSCKSLKEINKYYVESQDSYKDFVTGLGSEEYINVFIKDIREPN